jgi:hypothetical protein
MIRELWYKDELTRLRQDRDEQIQRSLIEEERAEQGILREQMMEESLLELIGMVTVVNTDPSNQTVGCLGCLTYMREKDPSKLVHLKTCRVLKAIERVEEFRQRRGTTEPRRDPEELVRLRQAIMVTHGLSMLAACPSCGAERTNGERHDDRCPLMALAREREALERCAACEAIYGTPHHRGIPHP